MGAGEACLEQALEVLRAGLAGETPIILCCVIHSTRQHSCLSSTYRLSESDLTKVTRDGVRDNGLNGYVLVYLAVVVCARYLAEVLIHDHNSISTRLH